MGKIDFDPDKFILSEILVQQTSTGKIYTQSILLHGHEVKITGKASESLEGHVDLNSYRPKELLPTNASFLNKIAVEEYFEDILSFFFVLAQIEVEISNLPISLLKVCEYHIQRSNRLIDNDVYTYCDEAIVVSELILNSSDPTFLMPKEDKLIMWQQYKQIIFDEFQDYIYITKYKLESELDVVLKPYLVKLVL